MVQTELKLGLSRKTDHHTSHEAGASLGSLAQIQTERIMQSIRDDGPATADELSARLGFAVWRRLSDLLIAGKLVRTGITRPGTSGRSQAEHDLQPWERDQ